jgi:hypothetical protein
LVAAQKIRLLIDIGDRTIEIPLRGNLDLQTQNISAHQATSPARSRAQGADDDDKEEYMIQMRGWLMTVATLFLGIAFQAATQPPAWMPIDQIRFLFRKGTSRAALMAKFYMLANIVTFGMALIMVVGLAGAKPNDCPTPRAVRILLAILASTVTLAFAIGAASNNLGLLGLIIVGLLLCVKIIAG